MHMLKIIASATLALVAVAAVFAGPSEAGARPSAEPMAAAVSVPITRDQVISAATRQTAINQRVDRIDARLTTYGQFLSAANPTAKTAWPAPGTLVWVVAVSGQVQPSAAHGLSFPWGVFAYDATTGNYIATAANKNGTWPAYFDTLPDLSR